MGNRGQRGKRHGIVYGKRPNTENATSSLQQHEHTTCQTNDRNSHSDQSTTGINEASSAVVLGAAAAGGLGGTGTGRTLGRGSSGRGLGGDLGASRSCGGARRGSSVGGLSASGSGGKNGGVSREVARSGQAVGQLIVLRQGIGELVSCTECVSMR